ncbi:DUF308 domain-containing protein [candidate division WWE3 bacterium]|nr:DUF308 domain-containing protein [candidate division WWE3 bacterium]
MTPILRTIFFTVVAVFCLLLGVFEAFFPFGGLVINRLLGAFLVFAGVLHLIFTWLSSTPMSKAKFWWPLAPAIILFVMSFCYSVSTSVLDASRAEMSAGPTLQSALATQGIPTMEPLPTSTLLPEEFAPNIGGGAELPPAVDSGNLLLQGALPEFTPPNTTRFAVVEIVLPNATWAQPGFNIPWPKHEIQDNTRQDSPPANGVEIWYAFQVRPGDIILGNGTGVATASGWYDEGCSFWYENTTAFQQTVFVRNGEIMVMNQPNDEATMDEMALVLLKFVISTNGMPSAAFLGKIQ